MQTALKFKMSVYLAANRPTGFGTSHAEYKRWFRHLEKQMIAAMADKPYTVQSLMREFYSDWDRDFDYPAYLRWREESLRRG